MLKLLVVTIFSLVAPLLFNFGHERLFLFIYLTLFMVAGFIKFDFYLLPIAGLILSTLNVINLKNIELSSVFDRNSLDIEYKISSVNINESYSSNAQLSKVETPLKYNQVSLKGEVISPSLLKGHKVNLSWYHTLQEPKLGEVWRFNVKLKRPWGFANPGGFDYQGSLLRNQVSAVGYIKNNQNAYVVSSEAATAVQQFRSNLDKELSGLSQAGLLRALVDGNKKQVTTAQWDVLQNTGTLHLFVVSGMHVGIIFLIGRLLCLWLLRPITLFRVDIRLRQTALLGGLCFALSYGYISGFSLPVVRALSMLFSVTLLYLYRQNFPVSLYWLFSMIVVLTIDPMAIYFAGFWLSFMAVGVLLATFSGQLKLSRFGQLVSPQWVVAIGLMPVLLLMSLPVAPQSLLANLIAVPVVTMILLPLLVLEVIIVALKLPVVALLIECIDWIMNILWWFLQALSSLPTYYVSSDPIMWLPVCVAVLFVFILRGMNFYLLPLLLLIIVVGYPSEPLKNGDFNVYVLDVGQGQSQLIKTANHYLLYDVGGKYGETFSATKFAVWPYLKHQGIHALDGLVISHDDRDHTGDYLWLQSQLDVEKVWAGQPKLKNELECSGYPSWKWDGVSFGFAPQVKALRDNDESCVLRISSHSGSALIVGDIEKKAENQLHDWWAKTDLLIAPHHGSNTSSTEAFISMVDPTYVVFSAGKNNHFGHPHHKVEARYKELSVKRFETSQTGHIRFEFRAGHSPEPAALYRQQSLRFWLSS